MGFELFIDIESMSKSKHSTEDLIVDCAGEVLGKNYYGGYQALFGDKSGLGKTYDKCYTCKLSEYEGANVHPSEDMNSIFDTIFDYKGETIALQIKTSHEYDKAISLARISVLGDAHTKKENYKNKVKDRMIKENISKFYLPYTIISEGKIFLYLISEVVDGTFKFYPDDEKYYRSSVKQTGLTLNVEFLPVLKYKKVSISKRSQKKKIVPKKKVSLNTFSQLRNDAVHASKMFNRSNKLVLGEKWGDKGKAFEIFFVNYLLDRYDNISLPEKKTSFIDFIVVGLSAIQLKTSSTKNVELWPTFGRSSVDDLNIINRSWTHSYIDDPVPVLIHTDKSDVRCENVRSRLTTDITKSGEIEYNLLAVDLYREKSNVYILSTLCEDETLKYHGSFLKRNFYKSKGGENGNQTHFRIKMKGLISSVEDDANSIFESNSIKI